MIKKELYDNCVAYVNRRLSTIKEALENAQNSANEETKSSAGDKHETGRAMMQLETEKNLKQRNEALKLKQLLDQIDPNKKCNTVSPGALVTTNNEKLYISISAGKMTLDDDVYFTMAISSPLGLVMNGKKAGEKVSFNGKEYQLLSIC